jgi:hypothetical protein
MSTIESTVAEIEADPFHIAVRLITLERLVAVMREHLEVLTLRLGGCE